jgi:hypothetical protein
VKITKAYPRYDAEIDTDVCNAHTNADLTLTLKMGFRQINPAGGAATGTYHDYGDATAPARNIRTWDNTSWEQWKANFVRTAQAFWNGKFWLINGTGVLPFEDRMRAYIPNFYCKFKLVGSDAASGHHHHVIDVVRLAPNERWFGSHESLYDSLDTNAVEKGRDSRNRPIMQRAHVHEVGHLLGLGHVAIGQASCPANGDTNAGACYGTTDIDKNSVMGQGMQLRDGHAQPWLDALAGMTGQFPASPPYRPAAQFVRPVTAARRRHYPRTLEEYEANRAILQRMPGR